ncbi:MAG: BrnA antitoxin family protein [Roseiarcus sp.]|jgi:uncharacterized protein (DUF4415 family)
MSKTKTVRVVLIDGKAFEKKAKGALVPLLDRTDYDRLDRMPDSEVERVAANDADGPPMTDEEWARGEIRRPIKIPVGLKLDDDVLGWFKAQGRGYQTRINAVLRRYVEARRKAG